jgi:hypothetical protein
MKINTAKLTRLYLFSSTQPPPAEEHFDISRYYTKPELDELELEPDRGVFDKSKNIIHYLNTDWDTGRGSFRNSGVGLFDSFFSSLGNGLSSLCPDSFKIFLGLKFFIASLFFNKNYFSGLKQNISINTLAGRIIRSPFHILDSLFSVSGQALSKNNLFAPVSLLVSVLGLSNSYLKNLSFFNPEIHYNNLPGTIGRSALHQFSSCLTNKVSEICNKSLLSNFALAGLSTIGFKFLPQDFKKHNIDWRNLDGLLAQNIFHISDSIFASLGSNIFRKIQNSPLAIFSILSSSLGIAISTNYTKPDLIKKLLNKEFIFTQVDSKFYRSMIHFFDSLIFNIGTKIGKMKYAGLLTFAYTLGVAGAGGFLKGSNPFFKGDLNNRKISMNTLAGLIQRLPFDFVEALISSSSNNLAGKINPFVGVLLGPALSFRLGEVFKNKSTQFNSLTGLLNKHLVHFWDNLMSTSGYNFGQTILGYVVKPDNRSKGSLLSDGKWITSQGRIVPKMVLGQQL